MSKGKDDIMNIVAFPNLNLGPTVLNPVAFNLFGRDIMWYGVIITAAIICGVIYVLMRAKKEQMLEDDVYDCALIVVVTAIIFARLYYVVFDPDPNYKNFIDVIAIWEGGLGIYGAIIGGALASFLVCKWKKIYFSRFADMVCPAVMLGQAIGRWGNFMNGEAYGSVERFDFFFVSFDISEQTLTSPFLMNINGINAQPTFLYESVWNIIGFILIVTVINRRRRFAGMTACFYFAWYGFGRMFIEGLRTDSLYIPGSDVMRVSQLIGLATFLFAVCAIIIKCIKAKNTPFDVASPVYYGARLEKLYKDGALRCESDGYVSAFDADGTDKSEVSEQSGDDEDMKPQQTKRSTIDISENTEKTKE